MLQIFFLSLAVVLECVHGQLVETAISESCSNLTVTAVYQGLGNISAVEWYYSRRISTNLLILATDCTVFGSIDSGFPPSSRMMFLCPSTHPLPPNTYKLVILDVTETEMNSTWGAAFRISGTGPTSVVTEKPTSCSSTTTSSTSTAIPITSPTSSTTTRLVTPNTKSTTSTSTTTKANASISTSTTTTTSIKTATRTTNSTVPSHLKTQSEKEIVIIVPSVLGGLFIAVIVVIFLVRKIRKNLTQHNSRAKHHTEGHTKKENKGSPMKRHLEYSEYLQSHRRFSDKELYGYKMYSGQIEIKRNPLYSHHLERHMNMSHVTNRGQYHYDQLYNGNQFLVYQMPSARTDPLYPMRGHMLHSEHRYPRATTLRTQDNTIVTDYSWNWN